MLVYVVLMIYGNSRDMIAIFKNRKDANDCVDRLESDKKENIIHYISIAEFVI